MLTFIVTLFTGIGMGFLLAIAPKEHKQAEKRYWEGLQKYAVKDE